MPYNIPAIDFYTIPRVDIFATDSAGGYIGTIEKMTDLESDAAICYIDKERKCYLITENSTEFLQNASNWSNRLVPYEKIKFYISKDEAEKENAFIDISELNVEE